MLLPGDFPLLVVGSLSPAGRMRRAPLVEDERHVAGYELTLLGAVELSLHTVALDELIEAQTWHKALVVEESILP